MNHEIRWNQEIQRLTDCQTLEKATLRQNQNAYLTLVGKETHNARISPIVNHWVTKPRGSTTRAKWGCGAVTGRTRSGEGTRAGGRRG